MTTFYALKNGAFPNQWDDTWQWHTNPWPIIRMNATRTHESGGGLNHQRLAAESVYSELWWWRVSAGSPSLWVYRDSIRPIASGWFTILFRTTTIPFVRLGMTLTPGLGRQDDNATHHVIIFHPAGFYCIRFSYEIETAIMTRMNRFPH